MDCLICLNGGWPDDRPSDTFRQSDRQTDNQTNQTFRHSDKSDTQTNQTFRHSGKSDNQTNQAFRQSDLPSFPTILSSLGASDHIPWCILWLNILAWWMAFSYLVMTVTFCNPHQCIPEPSAPFPSPQAHS